ncbi:Ger(x)C family spore germination protein [Cohnella soli]|uniref:Ger(X)C family spore germination protein n=1 Tax=Cohnella soli TaxID=425005 RepID=A0ABW0HRA2_9BACL
MRARALLLSLCAAFILPLTGCWDVKTLQDVNYFTGVGIDYVDGKYRIYVQQLDFSNVAKSDTGKTSNPATVWVGQTEGASMSDATMKLYQTAQQTVFWGHLECVVLSEAALRSGDLISIFDRIIRSPEIRYTPWIYSTKTDIAKLFSTKPFFNLSPMNSILYSPKPSYEQWPIIAPMRLNAFARELREPGETVLVPSIGLAKDTWARDKKKDPKLEIDGVFAMHNDTYIGWLEDSKLNGLRWFVKHTPAGRMTLTDNGKMLATLKMGHPKAKVKMEIKNGEPVFHVDVKVNAALYELGKELSEEKLSKLAADAVAGEIRSTFEEGMRNGHADLYDLEHRLYRKKFKTWKTLTQEGRLPLRTLALGDVNVKVHIVQSGMFKLKRQLKPFSAP